MKFRYAAALALLDWYLMTAPPPAGQSGSVQSVKADIKAPLSKWTIVGIFPSKKACETKRGANAQQRCLASENTSGTITRLPDLERSARAAALRE